MCDIRIRLRIKSSRWRSHFHLIRSLARAQTALAIRTLTGVCGSKAAPAAARVSAASGLLDRGWGKAPQPHASEDDKDIRITIRQITEGKE